jgi:hypothetical protein
MDGHKEDLSQVPRPPRAAEIGVAIAKGAASAIPFAGGPAAEIIDQVLRPVLAARREKWFQSVGEAIEDLRRTRSEFDLKALLSNEEAMTVLVSASTAAIKTHEEEKLTALRNAVINSAIGLGADTHEQLMFVRFVDELTALHLRLLVYLRDPGEWYDKRGIQRPALMGARAELVDRAFPELAGRRETYLQVVRELSARGLATEGLTGMVTERAMWDSLITPLGRRFLEFVMPPSVQPQSDAAC